MVCDKFRKLLWPILGVLLCAVFQLQPGQAAQTTANPAAEKAVRQLIESLPPKSTWRIMMEHGAKGDGIRRPWMNEMRAQGIKLAVLTFEFEWTHGAASPKDYKNWRLASAQYFADYDYLGSEPIGDPGRLDAIKASGLAEELETAGLARTKRGFWFESPGEQHPPQETGTGFHQVFLAENEWLPVQMFPWFGQYEKGTTALMHAARLGDTVRIRRLLAKGADVNAVSPSGWTVLDLAAAGGGPAAIKLLLNAGATINPDPGGGGSALVVAVANDRPENVKVLLAAGADPNSRNGNGQSVLSLAIQQHNTEIVALLKRAGAQK